MSRHVPQRLGRSHQRPGILTAGQQAALIVGGASLVLLSLWHLSVVLTTGVPLTGAGVTLRGLLTLAPLDLPSRYGAVDPVTTLTVFALLIAAAAAVGVWGATRTPRRRSGAVGLADKAQARRSAGEIRARKQAAWTRRGSVQAGLLDVDCAPLNEVGLLLGTTTDGHEPVVLSLGDPAGIIVARLLHGADLTDNTMVDVVSWALELERSTTARDILDGHPDAELFWAKTLHAASEGADETLSSVRMTLAQKVEPILSRTVMRQMLPAPGVQVFDPAQFVASTDTLVLITDDQAQTNVAPLTTMLLGEVIDAAKAHAARSHTGRLDPQRRVVGDEIANVAPLPKLPGLLSDSRGVGIQWFAAFQSVAQIHARWGEDDGRQILANLNCSLILGGLQDEKALDRFSALVGDTDVTEVSATLDAANSATGSSITVTERTALRAEEIRLIPDGQALVIYRNAPAMLVTLTPWTQRPDGADTAAAITRIRAARITHQP